MKRGSQTFSRGLYALADDHACVLAGGDTTRSASGLVITITADGNRAYRARSAAIRCAGR